MSICKVIIVSIGVELMLFASSCMAECASKEISCRCGTTSTKSYTFCLDGLSFDANDPCDNWSHCKSCSNGLNRCLSCPENKTGWKCDQDIIDPNSARIRKRRFFIGPLRETIANVIEAKKRMINKIADSVINVLKPATSPPLDIPPACYCNNGGYCDRNRRCICLYGYSGIFCENKIDNGPIFPGAGPMPPRRYPQPPTCFCYNGGTCFQNTRCVCAKGFTGTSCQTVIPERKISCPDPGFVSNAERLKSDGSPASGIHEFSEGSGIIFTCNDEYGLRGSGFLLCTSSGSWSAPLPECKLLYPRESKSYDVCEDPGEITNGNRISADGSMIINQQTFSIGKVLVFNCLPEFYLEGSSFMRCLPNGEWSNEKPICKKDNEDANTSENEIENEIAYCENPGKVPNSKRTVFAAIDARQNSPAYFAQETELEFECDIGFSLQGQNILICLENGEWSSPLPSCRRK